MTIRPTVARIMSLCVAAAIATATAGFAQDTPTTPTPAQADAPTLPVKRTLTDTTGRKLDVTITEKTEKDIKLKTAAGKEFTLELNKLSAEDQTYIAGLKTPVIRVLYNGNTCDDAYCSFLALKKSGFEIVVMDYKDAHKIEAGDVSPLKDFDVVWYDLGSPNFKGICNQVEKLKIVMVAREPMGNDSKDAKKILIDRKKTKKLGDYIIQTNNFMVFNDCTEIKEGNGKVKLHTNEAILPDVFRALVPLVKQYHR